MSDRLRPSYNFRLLMTILLWWRLWAFCQMKVTLPLMLLIVQCIPEDCFKKWKRPFVYSFSKNQCFSIRVDSCTLRFTNSGTFCVVLWSILVMMLLS